MKYRPGRLYSVRSMPVPCVSMKREQEVTNYLINSKLIKETVPFRHQKVCILLTSESLRIQQLFYNYTQSVFRWFLLESRKQNLSRNYDGNRNPWSNHHSK